MGGFNRMSGIVDAIYRSYPDSVRQVLALSRQDAERLPRLPTLAIISIRSPDDEPAALDGFAHLLRLCFSDVDFLNPSISLRARSRPQREFTVEQASAVHCFIRSLPAEVKSLVVHCEGGFSRSCAIALAVHRVYGYRTDLTRLGRANPSVALLMMSTWCSPLFE